MASQRQEELVKVGSELSAVGDERAEVRVRHRGKRPASHPEVFERPVRDRTQGV